MSRRNRTRVLSEIVRVREVQERAAEMAVAQVNIELRTLGAEKEAALDRLTDDQERWAMSMAAPVLDPGVAAAWSSAVLRTQDGVREVGSRITEAETRKADRSQDWRHALARTGLAGGLARDAIRKDLRAREEASLADLTDRLARKGQQP